ncbi:MAG: hypoxanthine phosphoribosyltransferase [Deltaproteobacteria bacterium]|nr:hypoxanthine phosphoribosyltransferase [Deltaproteobacteria bacterium]MBW2075425.1 hypoxanthine phosphoribosyltransferase [Deltaproteobacteria bacterium]RLB81979.1 MAG: hypoxanthine phosphoribosyltransferase [Deltaproteobacteria bacterium]
MPEQLIPVLSRAEIAQKVKSLAHQISKDYAEKELCIIGVLNGVFVFLADLVRELTLNVQIDFIRLASYDGGTVSSGNVRITKEIELDVKNRDVLIVEDIVDSGLTVAFLMEYLKPFYPKSIKVCTLIDKTERRQVQVPIDYVGHVIDQGFLVGYGLDFDQKYRALPEIYHLKQ